MLHLTELIGGDFLDDFNPEPSPKIHTRGRDGAEIEDTSLFTLVFV